MDDSDGTVGGRLDAIEIKVSVGASDMDAAADAFGLDLQDGRRRSIYFCEDVRGPGGPAALPLLEQGVILRLRKNKGKADDSTVKLRPCGESQLTPRWVDEDGGEGWDFRVEGDWVGKRKVISASLEAKVADGDLASAIADDSLSDVFSDVQRKLLRDCAPAPVDFSELSALGPVAALKWQQTVDGHEIAFERWDVSDELRFLELSIRVEPDDAVAAQRNFERLCTERGIDVAAVTETKTRLVLEHLARR
jgi:hypothetical protein